MDEELNKYQEATFPKNKQDLVIYCNMPFPCLRIK